MNNTLQISCPHCAALNRVPNTRLTDNPRCGKCHQNLFSGQPLDLSAATFSQHASRSDIPLLVDFWAPWCGPCKMMAPQFAEAAPQLEPQIRLAKVNTEVEQNLGAQYGIRSIPTLALFLKGKEVARQAGAMMSKDIVAWVRGQL